MTDKAIAPEFDHSESRMHRFRVGDKVSFQDNSDFPPIHMEGLITSYANEEASYLNVDFGKSGIKTLTEDELVRIG